jgi:hypothetical protein
MSSLSGIDFAVFLTPVLTGSSYRDIISVFKKHSQTVIINSTLGNSSIMPFIIIRFSEVIVFWGAEKISHL